MGFVRSHVRRMSLAWPPRRDALKRGRRPYVGPNKRQKWEHQCALCGGWFAAKQIEIDHIEPCGELRSLDDLPRFVAVLLSEPDNFRVTCTTCNQSRSRKPARRLE